MGYQFETRPGVLIPRQETELLVEETINLIARVGNNRELNLADVCCGTGCIGLSIKKMCGRVNVVLSDINPDCISLTEQNTESLGLTGHVRILHGDLFDPFMNEDKFDIIVSNPPYVRTDDIPGLQKEISLHEPCTALDGGVTGLDFYRRLAEEGKQHLNRQNGTGYMIIEIGYDQKAGVTEIFTGQKYQILKTRVDYSGFDRVMIIKWD
jgi:release factor glutamine methyltransferase